MTPSAATLTTELRAVTTGLGEAARSQAGAILSEADRDAAAELANAREEAQRILRQAEHDGTEAASRAATMRVARARREARRSLLTVQRTTYDALRARALDAVERQASSPEGERLTEQLEALVQARIGRDTPARRAPLGAVAERGACVASIGPEDLVEQAMQSLSSEIAALWA